MNRFTVLMYHRIVSGQCPVPGGNAEEARYAVDLETFRWHMDYIADSGRRGVSTRSAQETLAAGGRVPSDWVVVTFDDGNLSDFVHARPLLLERGFRATFFVGGDRLDAEGGLTPDMLSQMAADDLDIGSHGMTHRFLPSLTAEEEEEELRQSKELLERITGGAVDYFAPPGGRIDRRSAVALVPVTAETTRERFRDMVESARLRLLPLYAKDRGLRLARRMLGEAGYRKVRALGLGK
jgi:peptidoglycan/xylan/chitin deacetylase (PgdA/CDA1 family)